jgi:F-type H+-transporting ATPase subunit alpha
MPMEKQVTIIFAGTNGFTDKYPALAIASYEKQLFEFIENKHPELLTEIRDKRLISDELNAKMKQALADFDGVFQA